MGRAFILTADKMAGQDTNAHFSKQQTMKVELSDDRVVERLELLGRDPVFLVMARAHRVALVPGEVLRVHREARDEATLVVASVPSLGDLHRVGLVARRVPQAPAVEITVSPRFISGDDVVFSGCTLDPA
jgi:hypothetical protein